MQSTRQVKYPAGISQPVVLIGFMACGKSTLGRLLARHLGLKFVDTDREIERWVGMPIGKIFKDYGETRFRQLEMQVLKKELQPCRVISAGGGLVLRLSNRVALKNGARVLWLDPSWNLLWARLRRMNDGKRPLLCCPDGSMKTQNAVRRIWAERRSSYERTATSHIKIRAGESEVAILKKLVSRLNGD